MSLINQMLKDLEQRNASADGMKPLAGEVRTVQSPKATTNWLRLSLVTAAILGLAASLWLYQNKPAVNAAAVPAPALAKKSPPPPPPPVPAAPTEAQTPALPPLPRLPGMDMELSTPPLPSAETKRRSSSASSVAAVPGAPADAETSALPPQKAAGTSLPAASRLPIKSVSAQQKSDNLYRQAVSMLQQGRVAEARAVLGQAIDENPLNHDARQLVVGMLVESKRNEEAMNLLQEGVRIAPEQTGFVMALARLQVETGNLTAALQTLEQGARYAAEEAEYQGFHAALLQRDGRHEDAVVHYLTALRSDPANASWLVGIGISLQEQAKFADAREAFERARQSDSLTPELSGFVEQRLRQLQGK